MVRPVFVTLDDIKQIWGMNDPEAFVKDIPKRGYYERKNNFLYSRYDIEKKLKNGNR